MKEKLTESQTDARVNGIVARFRASGIEQQVDYGKFSLYSIVTHSTSIEGSTVTEVENQLMFDEGISPGGRTLQEQMMNLDLRDAYLRWLPEIKSASVLSAGMLRDMAAMVMRRTGTVYHTALGDFDSAKGDFRLVSVRAGVSGRSYMAYQKVPGKMEEFCRWLSAELEKVAALEAAARYRLSFAAHYRLVTIHPWVDGNGRAARLLMNALQHRLGLPMSRISKEEKAGYIQALVDAREADDECIFTEWAMKSVAADLERELEVYERDTALD